MSAFTKKMIRAMGVTTLVRYVLFYTLIRMAMSGLEIIEGDTPWVRYAVGFGLWGAADVGAVLAAAASFTKRYRINGLPSFPTDEFRFYRNLMLIFTALAAAFAALCVYAVMPGVSSAFKEGIRKINLMGYSPEYYEEQREGITARRDKITGSIRAGFGIGCFTEAAALFIAAPRLVKLYQTPQPERGRLYKSYK